jgi:glyoxylase-like metal-dependent hydrolase (beta-lactamase superfamily II)
VTPDVARLRADNPSPYTLDGTNTWVVGRDPAWIVDPGPALDAHLDAIAAEVAARGGAGGIALTHDHADHVEGVGALRERLGGDVPVAAARFPADIALADGATFGPFSALAIPGHADDHLALVAGGGAFTGDAVLGHGSVFVTGRLREYLAALERLRALQLDVLYPGHGPPVEDPEAKLTEYIEHRLDRERKLVAALDAGLRTRDELLDAAWSDAPPELRHAAEVTLLAHLGKLQEEGRLPAGVN